MKSLFIFQASWDYCNGAVCVIASSRRKAIALANKESRHEAERRNHVADRYVDNKAYGEWTYGLTFVTSFPVSVTEKDRIVLDAWNWA